MYLSQIHPDNILIDDSNYTKFRGVDVDVQVKVDGKPKSRGYIPRDFAKFPHGHYAAPFPLPIIDRAEWPNRIEYLDKTNGWPKDIKVMAGFDSLDQNGTNYCWINAIIQAAHYARSGAGMDHVPLSPASIGAKIKNFRNVGGWGSEGLKYLIDHGAVPQSLWPANAIDRRYDTPEAEASRADYRALEWWELIPRSFEQLVSALMHGFAVPIGLPWWSHEVLADKVYRVGRDSYEPDIDNSWGKNWGENGHGRLSESKSISDDQCAVRVMMAA